MHLIMLKRLAICIFCILCTWNKVLAQDVDPILQLPNGFSASVFHKGVGSGARHIDYCDNDVLYVHLEQGIAALQDSNADGEADSLKQFGDMNGTGVRCAEGTLYVSSDSAVYKYNISDTQALPTSEAQLLIELPSYSQHAAKSITLDGNGGLYVNIGAPSNNCQKQDRRPGSPGIRPCPLLEKRAGIWRFDANATGQTLDSGVRYATGVRNAVALRWNPLVESLYLVQHGRDQLYPFFSQWYDEKDNAELPAEEFHRIEQGSNIGWPYTYYDGRRSERMIAPEYGGDGKTPAKDSQYQDPLFAFPAHWAPNDLLFYTGSQFPKKYHAGAFIAFHGSWNRAPFPQEGYKVVFLPLEDGAPSGSFEVFADGFAASKKRKARGAAKYRPMGLAQTPKGELFVVDSREGRVWKISYQR